MGESPSFVPEAPSGPIRSKLRIRRNVVAQGGNPHGKAGPNLDFEQRKMASGTGAPPIADRYSLNSRFHPTFRPSAHKAALSPAAT
jgi:hypothetical protein